MILVSFRSVQTAVICDDQPGCPDLTTGVAAPEKDRMII
jgi:hypothetical protein